MTDTNTLLGWLNQFVTHRRIDEVMDEADYEAVQDMNTHLRAQEARIAELAPWKEAVIDALAVCCGDCAIGTPPSDVLKLIASINQQFTEQNCKDREDERIAALTKDAEPIYQWKAPYSGAWRDISKDAYLEIKGYIHNITGNGEVRVIYTRPPAPKAITAEDVTDEMLASLNDFHFISYAKPKALVAAAVNAFNGVKP